MTETFQQTTTIKKEIYGTKNLGIHFGTVAHMLPYPLALFHSERKVSVLHSQFQQSHSYLGLQLRWHVNAAQLRARFQTNSHCACVNNARHCGASVHSFKTQRIPYGVENKLTPMSPSGNWVYNPPPDDPWTFSSSLKDFIMKFAIKRALYDRHTLHRRIQGAQQAVYFLHGLILGTQADLRSAQFEGDSAQVQTLQNKLQVLEATKALLCGYSRRRIEQLEEVEGYLASVADEIPADYVPGDIISPDDPSDVDSEVDDDEEEEMVDDGDDGPEQEESVVAPAA